MRTVLWAVRVDYFGVASTQQLLRWLDGWLQPNFNLFEQNWWMSQAMRSPKFKEIKEKYPCPAAKEVEWAGAEPSDRHLHSCVHRKDCIRLKIGKCGPLVLIELAGKGHSPFVCARGESPHPRPHTAHPPVLDGRPQLLSFWHQFPNCMFHFRLLLDLPAALLWGKQSHVWLCLLLLYLASTLQLGKIAFLDCSKHAFVPVNSVIVLSAESCILCGDDLCALWLSTSRYNCNSVQVLRDHGIKQKLSTMWQTYLVDEGLGNKFYPCIAVANI